MEVSPEARGEAARSAESNAKKFNFEVDRASFVLKGDAEGRVESFCFSAHRRSPYNKEFSTSITLRFSLEVKLGSDLDKLIKTKFERATQVAVLMGQGVPRHQIV